MKKITPSTIKRFAESQGVEFSWSLAGRTYALECWSPEGKRFAATGTHFYSLYGEGFHAKPDWTETLKDLQAAVRLGFEDCDDEECDICHEE